MGAYLSAFAEWLAGFLTALSSWFLRSLGPSLLLSLGIGFGVYSGLSVLESRLDGVLMSYRSLPVALLDLARLLGAVFVIKLFASAISVRISMLASRVFFVRRL